MIVLFKDEDSEDYNSNMLNFFKKKYIRIW